MKDQLSMKHIAERAGVHPTTVSRCLKNSQAISAATKERVLAIARELGYRTHPYVSTLMQARHNRKLGRHSPILGFLTFFPTRDGWKYSRDESHNRLAHAEDCFRCACQQAEARGYRMEEIWTPLHEVSLQRAGDILYARGIEGVVLSPMPEWVTTLDWQWNRLAVVAVDMTIREPRLHRVRNDSFRTMLRALEECRALGYRRIGLAVKEAAHRHLEQRWLAAYLLKQWEWGTGNPVEALFAQTWRKSVFLSWFKKNKPDAVIVGNHVPVMRWFAEEGYVIPRDVGLVSLNAPLEGPQSGMYQDWARQGARAVNLLIDLLNNNSRGLHDSPSELVVTGFWKPGETLRRQSKGGRQQAEAGGAAPGSGWKELISPALPKHVSIREVAREAGVHPGTATKCLNDKSEIPESTRLRVQEIADKLGYRRHTHLSSLMRVRRRGEELREAPALGFVTFLAASEEEEASVPQWRAMFESARRQADSLGFRLEGIRVRLDETFPESFHETLRSRGIAGVILSPLRHPRATLECRWEGLAVVAIGPSLGERRLHRVRSDYFKATALAMEECHRLGYRRMGIALPEEVNRSTGYRCVAACLVRQRDFGLDEPPVPLLAKDWNRDVFFEWVREHEPDVILAMDSESVTAWLHSAGYSIPREIGVVDLNVERSGSRQSGIHEQWDVQGERAVNVVVDLLQDGRSGLEDTPNISLVRGVWNAGKTIRRQPANRVSPAARKRAGARDPVS